jgi:hypothetical protein
LGASRGAPTTLSGVIVICAGAGTLIAVPKAVAATIATP